MDQLELLKKWIHQYIQLLIKKHPLQQHPFDVCSKIIIPLCLDIKSIITPSISIDLVLLQYYTEELYFLENRQLVDSQNSLASFLISQSSLLKNYVGIVVRILILGLSLKVPITAIRIPGFSSRMWKKNFRKMFNSCQLQMGFIQTTLTTSELDHQFALIILKDLQTLEQTFQVLQFYQQLGDLWRKLEIQPLITWAQKGAQSLKHTLQSKKNSQQTPKSQNKPCLANSQRKDTQKPRKSFVQKIEFSRPSQALKTYIQSQKKIGRTSLPRTLHQKSFNVVKFSGGSFSQIQTSYCEQSVLYSSLETREQQIPYSKKSCHKNQKSNHKQKQDQQTTAFYVDQTPEKKTRRSRM